MDEISLLNDLPYDIKYKLCLSLDRSTLLNLCNLDREYNYICNSESFWRAKSFKDHIDKDKPENISWKDSYLRYYDPRQIKVCIGTDAYIPKPNDCHGLGDITISRDDSLNNVYGRILKAYLLIYGHSPYGWKIEPRDINGNIAIRNPNLPESTIKKPSDYLNLHYFTLLVSDYDYGDVEEQSIRMEINRLKSMLMNK